MAEHDYRGAPQMDNSAAQNAQSEDIDTIDFVEYVEIFLRRWPIMLATMVLVFAIGMVYTFSRHPVYTSTAKIVVATGRASGAPDSDIPVIGDLQALTKSRSIQTQVEIISSPDIIDEALDRLPQDLRDKGFRGTVLGNMYEIKAGKDTDVITIDAMALDPHAAAAFADSIVTTYFSRDLESSNKATRQARIYLEEKMQLAERDLAKARNSMAAFKAKTGLLSPDAQLAKRSEYIEQLRVDADSARTALAGIRSRNIALARRIKEQNEYVVSATTIQRNPQFIGILQEIDKLNSTRAELLQEYISSSREVTKVDGQIEDAEQRLKKVAQTVLSTTTNSRNPLWENLLKDFSGSIAESSALDTKVQVLDRCLVQREMDFKVLPELERELTTRMQNIAILERTYDMLSQKYYTLLLSEQSMLPNGILISKPRVPEAPSYPRTDRNIALFAMLGIMLSVVVAIVVDRVDIRVHDPSVMPGITDLPSLASIPFMDNEDAAYKQIGKLKHNSIFLESFRILRNNIMFSAIDNPLKVLAVSSPGPGEGKSTLAVNLAIAMAMDGKKVLLVDCDLRRPSIHNWMNLSREIGLTNVVKGLSNIKDAVCSTDIENVFCLPSGPLPPNPTEFLNSKHSRNIIKELSGMYDMLILDCPPCTGLSDVQVISTMADGVLLVVTINRTLKTYLHVALSTLSQVKAPIIGYVLNMVDSRRQGYGYYYNYDYDEQGGRNKFKRRCRMPKSKN